MALVIALAAVAGLLVGSFLNVVAYRLPRGESLVRPRSRCPHCDTQLRAIDNIPVVSWLVLRGPLPPLRSAGLGALPARRADHRRALRGSWWPPRTTLSGSSSGSRW